LIVLKLKEENVCFNIRGERDEIQVSFEEWYDDVIFSNIFCVKGEISIYFNIRIE
jgi:hypothetical protein